MRQTPDLTYLLIPAADLEPDGSEIRTMANMIEVDAPDLMSKIKVRRKRDGKTYRRCVYTWPTQDEFIILDGEAFQLVKHGPQWYTTQGPVGGRLLTRPEKQRQALKLLSERLAPNGLDRF